MRKFSIGRCVLPALLLAMMCTVPAFAGTWRDNDRGTWWERDDRTWPEDGWEEIDGRWYYFDRDGYLVRDRVVDIGYYVGLDGAWVPEQDEVVYIHNVYAHYETPCLKIYFDSARKYGDFWQVGATLYAWYDHSGPIESAPLYNVNVRIRENAEIEGYSSADAYFARFTGAAGENAENGPGPYLIYIRQDKKGYVTNAKPIP